MAIDQAYKPRSLPEGLTVVYMADSKRDIRFGVLTMQEAPGDPPVIPTLFTDGTLMTISGKGVRILTDVVRRHLSRETKTAEVMDITLVAVFPGHLPNLLPHV